MKIKKIIIRESIYKAIKEYLLSDPSNHERFIALLSGVNKTEEEAITYLSYELDKPEEKNLYEKSAGSISPTFGFLLKHFNKCKKHGFSLVYFHSHPFSDFPEFSLMDNEADIIIRKWQKKLYPTVLPPVSCVMGRKGLKCRYLNENEEFIYIEQLNIMGEEYVYNLLDRGKTSRSSSNDDVRKYDRQIRFLGEDFQLNLKNITVAIIGLGGTGSALAQQLVYMGVENFILCDNDTVEETNLNRFVGATEKDLGRSKVRVVGDYLKLINKSVRILALNNKVWEVKDEIKRADFIFGCVDSESARLTMNEISVRYLIPFFDVASGIFLKDDKTKVNMHTILRVVFPGETRCLVCNNDINFSVAQKELMDKKEKDAYEKAGYIEGMRDIPTPGVLSLNSLVVSMAVLEFQKLFAGFSRPSVFLWYNVVKNRLYNIMAKKNENCPVCGARGILGLGDIENPPDMGYRVKLSNHTKEWLSNLLKRAKNGVE